VCANRPHARGAHDQRVAEDEQRAIAAEAANHRVPANVLLNPTEPQVKPAEPHVSVALT
jgi:hypothetical protein